MGDVVNLNQFRKKQDRKKADDGARNNRVRYGRSGSKKKQDKEQKRRESAVLDHKKLTKEIDEESTAPPKN